MSTPAHVTIHWRDGTETTVPVHGFEPIINAAAVGYVDWQKVWPMLDSIPKTEAEEEAFLARSKAEMDQQDLEAEETRRG